MHPQSRNRLSGPLTFFFQKLFELNSN